MKGLSDIISHQEIISTLKSAVEGRRVSHAYLLAGMPGVGKRTVAMAFARALLCPDARGGDACGECGDCRRFNQGVHPDLHLIEPQGTGIKIQQVRQGLQGGVALTPLRGLRKVYIFHRAETMTAETANSLLKILEEPPEGVVCMLLTDKPYNLLPTIISRCQQLFFRPLKSPEIVEALGEFRGLPAGDAGIIAALSGGSLGRALAMAEDGGRRQEREAIVELSLLLRRGNTLEACRRAEEISGDKQDALDKLDMLMLWYRDLLIWRETRGQCGVANCDRMEEIKSSADLYTTGRLIDIINDIELAKSSLMSNANTRLALEVLFLRLAG